MFEFFSTYDFLSQQQGEVETNETGALQECGTSVESQPAPIIQQSRELPK